MVVTAMDFFHFRSISGLGRHVKRMARVVSKLINESEHINHDLLDAEQGGNVDEIVTDWKKLMAAYSKEENALEEINKDEFIIERSEEDEAAKVSQWLKRIQDPELKAVIAKLEREIARVINDIKNGAINERHEAKDVFQNRRHLLRYLKNWPKFLIIQSMKRLARNEYKMVRKDRGTEREIEHIFKQLNEVARFHKKKMTPQEKEKMRKKEKELAKKLERDVDTLVAHFETELKSICEILHDVNIFHMHMLHEVLDLEPKNLIDLSAEKFPQVQEQIMKEGLTKLINQMHENLKKMWQMSYYLLRMSKRVGHTVF